MQPIPLVELGAKPLSHLAETYPDRARALIAASRDAFGLASRLASAAALPVGDALCRSWLEKTQNPYRAEIADTARILQAPGVYALNLCYEWGCTSGAYRMEDGVALARVLDWPFPGLGANLVVAQQHAAAGPFLNITWPGVIGMFQGLAPSRFAIALNQAPMRRHRTGIFLDWARNRARAWKSSALPPAHLLRHVFETARDYGEACERLCHTPVALPVIFTVTGTQAGEGCVIERTEQDFALRPLRDAQSVSTANHFESHLNGLGHGWMPRALESHARRQQAELIAAHEVDEAFTWYRPPVANALSRLAFVADAGRGTLSVLGTEGVHPVTPPFHWARA